MPRTKVTLEQQIETMREELRQKGNRLNDMLEAKKEKDRKERTRRLCERAGYLESILPDTLRLSKERFQIFLNKTLINDFSHQILRGLIENESGTSEIEDTSHETEIAEMGTMMVEPNHVNIGYTGWQIDGGRVETNQQENCLQVFFDSRPKSDILDELKRNNFRWSPETKAWQRELNESTINAADRIMCLQPITGEAPTELQRTIRTGV